MIWSRLCPHTKAEGARCSLRESSGVRPLWGFGIVRPSLPPWSPGAIAGGPLNGGIYLAEVRRQFDEPVLCSKI
ncbi:unnamed protein product [Gadus morhua 'NCC']